MAENTKGFASTTDMGEKKITFSEIGTDLYAFTAEGDPNTAIIVGDDGCLVFDAQSTPAMANKVIERVRAVVEAHRGLSDEQSADFDAALVLVLANHIGDIAVLHEAIALAKRRMLDASQQQQQQQ